MLHLHDQLQQHLHAHRHAVLLLTNRRDRRDNLAKLELVENGGLTGCVKAYHEDTHLCNSE